MRAPRSADAAPPDSAPEDSARRRKAFRAGQRGEWIALLYLRAKGYRILARRFLVKGGEIDIIAGRGSTIAFVEVKLRADLEDARIAIAPAKRHRMSRAARVFITRHRVTMQTLRADAIYVAPWRWPLHIPAAFELDLD